MREVSTILQETAHRPWPLPTSAWQYYQEWNNALFLHWAVEPEQLGACVPQKLNIDLFDQKAYVSLVIFDMEKVRPRYLPPLRMVSNFHEINVRTYVEAGGKKGVFFLSLEAQKWLSTQLARMLSGLHYTQSNISRSGGSCVSKGGQRGLSLEVGYSLDAAAPAKQPLDLWLTERYAAFYEDGQALYRYDIHHAEWPVRGVRLAKLLLDFDACGFNLNQREPDLMHYSPGVGVLTWPKARVV